MDTNTYQKLLHDTATQAYEHFYNDEDKPNKEKEINDAIKILDTYFQDWVSNCFEAFKE